MTDIEYLIVPHLATKDLIRIFSKVSIDPSVSWNGTPCWVWTAGRHRKGYGLAWYGKHQKAHRLLFAWLVHPLPIGQRHGEIDHLCRNQSCCNPVHLEFTSTQINVLRSNAPAAANARKTHCVRGHPLTNDNLTPWSKRKNCRNCLQCHRERNLARLKPPITHCKYNHPLLGDNLVPSKTGARICRECHRRRGRERAREQRLLDKESVNERQRQYRLANPEKYKMSNKRNNDR